MKSYHREQIRSENINFILIFQTGKKSIFRRSFVRLNLIEYFEVIVFLCPTRQINMEKVSYHSSVTFTKIALKQTRVKTGGFSQIIFYIKWLPFPEEILQKKNIVLMDTLFMLIS